jgi:hypothetical protein
MKALIDQLFGVDAKKAMAASEQLEAQGAQSAADAKAILAALSREGTSDAGFFRPKHALLAAIQSCRSAQAREVFAEEGTGAIIAAYPKLAEVNSFALKILALLDEKEGLAFLAERVREPGGPSDFFVSTALGAVNPKTRHPGALFPALTPVLGYPDFRAVAVLDLANQLALAGTLEPHPAADHLAVLRGFLESKDEGKYSYAVSACLALAFVPGPAAEALLLAAQKHPDANVRMEATFALARRGHAGSKQDLAKAALVPESSQRAVAYLRELGLEKLIPPEVHEPVFAAKAEMIAWLAHPMEYGRPPETIELWDRRTLSGPPTDDRRELFLFTYSYPPNEPGEEPDLGVGLVGSVTFSLFGETRPAPEGTPEDALAAHCVWELEGNGDPRGEGRSLETGRKLLGFKATRN